MGSPNKKELKLLYKEAIGSFFILETGSGLSTKWLSLAAQKNDALFYSIDVFPVKDKYENVEYRTGWSCSYEDLVKPGDPDFVYSRYRGVPDEKVVLDGEENMWGDKDIMRYIFKETQKYPDFFFCDTGEYCGLSEWNIVKDVMSIGSKIALHDIYYPKSIKNFKVAEKI